MKKLVLLAVLAAGFVSCTNKEIKGDRSTASEESYLDSTKPYAPVQNDGGCTAIGRMGKWSEAAAMMANNGFRIVKDGKNVDKSCSDTRNWFSGEGGQAPYASFCVQARQEVVRNLFGPTRKVKLVQVEVFRMNNYKGENFVGVSGIGGSGSLIGGTTSEEKIYEQLNKIKCKNGVVTFN